MFTASSHEHYLLNMITGCKALQPIKTNILVAADVSTLDSTMATINKLLCPENVFFSCTTLRAFGSLRDMQRSQEEIRYSSQEFHDYLGYLVLQLREIVTMVGVMRPGEQPGRWARLCDSALRLLRLYNAITTTVSKADTASCDFVRTVNRASTGVAHILLSERFGIQPCHPLSLSQSEIMVNARATWTTLWTELQTLFGRPLHVEPVAEQHEHDFPSGDLGGHEKDDSDGRDDDDAGDPDDIVDGLHPQLLAQYIRRVGDDLSGLDDTDDDDVDAPSTSQSRSPEHHESDIDHDRDDDDDRGDQL